MTTTVHRQPISPKRILVVEDDPLAAHTIQTVLAMDGHLVEIAADGEQALTMFKAGEPDLVITDFKLGKMDGLELAEAIKLRSPAKPIILITAYAEKVGGGMGQVSNIDLLLSKPVTVAQLQEALKKIYPVPQGSAGRERRG